MTCEWMERVALALDGAWTPEVEAHVARCAECRELLADQALLREAPEIAPEVYAAVRAGVMERVRPSYAVWWRAAAAVVLAVTGIAWWTLRVPEAERLDIAVAAPKAPVVRPTAPLRSRLRTPLRTWREVPSEPRASASGRRDRTRPDPIALALAVREELNPSPPRLTGDVAVAMQTEDPEVFILLVGGDDE